MPPASARSTARRPPTLRLALKLALRPASGLVPTATFRRSWRTSPHAVWSPDGLRRAASPPGRENDSVYRRRRLIAVGVFAAVFLLIVMIVSAGGGDEEPSDAPADLGVPTTTLEARDRDSDRTDTETETTDTETESAGGVTPASPDPAHRGRHDRRGDRHAHSARDPTHAAGRRRGRPRCRHRRRRPARAAERSPRRRLALVERRPAHPLTSPRRRFASSRRRRDAPVGFVARRFFGTVRADSSRARMRSSAGSRLRVWLRVSCATVRPPGRGARRCGASARRRGARGVHVEHRLDRDAVTLACWPPGPDERLVRSSISARGTAAPRPMGRVLHGRRKLARGAPPAAAPFAQRLAVRHVALERKEGLLADCLGDGGHGPPTASFALVSRSCAGLRSWQPCASRSWVMSSGSSSPRSTTSPSPGEIVHAERTFQLPAAAAPSRWSSSRSAGSACSPRFGERRAGAPLRTRADRLGLDVRAVSGRAAAARLRLPRQRGRADHHRAGPAPRAERRDPLPWERLDETDAVYLTAGDAEAVRHASRPSARRERPGSARSRLGRRARRPRREREGRRRALPARAARPGAALRGAHDGRRGRQLGDGRRLGGQLGVDPAAGPLVDVYGAGDSFAAGLTHGMGEYGDIAEAVKLTARWSRVRDGAGLTVSCDSPSGGRPSRPPARSAGRPRRPRRAGRRRGCRPHSRQLGGAGRHRRALAEAVEDDRALAVDLARLCRQLVELVSLSRRAARLDLLGRAHRRAVHRRRARARQRGRG